jgi:hypothetical protein
MRPFLAVSMLAGLLLVGCDQKRVDAQAAAGQPAAPTPPRPTAVEIGVPECDEYLRKMEACLAKAPPTARGPMEQGLLASREAWSQAAGTAQGKEGLKIACKAAVDRLANNPTCK